VQKSLIVILRPRKSLTIKLAVPNLANLVAELEVKDKKKPVRQTKGKNQDKNKAVVQPKRRGQGKRTGRAGYKSTEFVVEESDEEDGGEGAKQD
jgi:hypothetical protein